jgi:hypothetical protein
MAVCTLKYEIRLLKPSTSNNFYEKMLFTIFYSKFVQTFYFLVPS